MARYFKQLQAMSNNYKRLKYEKPNALPLKSSVG